MYDPTCTFDKCYRCTWSRTANYKEFFASKISQWNSLGIFEEYASTFERVETEQEATANGLLAQHNGRKHKRLAKLWLFGKTLFITYVYRYGDTHLKI